MCNDTISGECVVKDHWLKKKKKAILLLYKYSNSIAII